MVSLVLEQINIGAHTILLGVQNFLRGVFRDAVYPKDIWHGDATYPRIFCRGVPKIGGVEYPMTPGPDTLDPTSGEGPSTTLIMLTGDLRELIRNVIREDLTLLSATGRPVPLTSTRASGSGKLFGVPIHTKHGRYIIQLKE